MGSVAFDAIAALVPSATTRKGSHMNPQNHLKPVPTTSVDELSPLERLDREAAGFALESAKRNLPELLKTSTDLIKAQGAWMAHYDRMSSKVAGTRLVSEAFVLKVNTLPDRRLILMVHDVAAGSNNYAVFNPQNGIVTQYTPDELILELGGSTCSHAVATILNFRLEQQLTERFAAFADHPTPGAPRANPPQMRWSAPQ